ncbi:response regulator [Rhodopirellula sallentina]|uniref:Signal transduction response regulator, receiver region domain protein n=1 Tax=Rhodopirellula sallentina SM41 TaxID=1263870 RepID=M5TSJ4_9BACT|nr:response regulator [Rhodopirellula sallentina]EMI52130.1 Signal transduction response regulator, receiver region domain protein [Rhodopirellula sallentina SM41]
MSDSAVTALVVDDEPLVRNLTIRALTREGFCCDSAADGKEAAKLAQSGGYDVVVTDLRMPNQNGHALAVELMELASPPAVVVLTGVTEPRLAKDLISRGIDDIVYKPIDYSVLSMKVRAIADRRARERSLAKEPASQPDATSATPASDAGVNGANDIANDGGAESPITQQDVADDFKSGKVVVPVCDTSLNVYRMSGSDEVDTKALAESIAKNDDLTQEIIGMAKSPFYNESGVPIADLPRAVVQLGQKRVGRLALAATAQAALLSDQPSPLNLGLIWARGVAAGLAIELMIEQGGHEKIADGLVLCAAMQDASRVALARLYPDRYKELIDECLETNQSLRDRERAVFGMDAREIHSLSMDAFGINRAEIDVLVHLHDSDEELAQLPEFMQTRVKLVRLAGIVAQAVIGIWEPWDDIRLPSRGAADELELWSIDSIIEQTRENSDGINFSPTVESQLPVKANATGVLSYCASVSDSFDFLEAIVRSLRADMERCFNPMSAKGDVLVNFLGVRSPEAEKMVKAATDANVVVAIESVDAKFYQSLPQTIALPMSYGAIHATIG